MDRLTPVFLERCLNVAVADHDSGDIPFFFTMSRFFQVDPSSNIIDPNDPTKEERSSSQHTKKGASRASFIFSLTMRVVVRSATKEEMNKLYKQLSLFFRLEKKIDCPYGDDGVM